MAALRQGEGPVYQGGILDLFSIPQSVDDQFAVGDIAEFQLRLRFHVPGLEDTLRLLLTPVLGENLLSVTAPSSIVRIRWRRNLGPIAIAAIIVSVAIIVTLLVTFVIFKIDPIAGTAAAGFVLALVIGGILAVGFARGKG